MTLNLPEYAVELKQKSGLSLYVIDFSLALSKLRGLVGVYKIVIEFFLKRLMMN